MMKLRPSGAAACCLLASTAQAQVLVPPENGAYVGAFADFGPSANEVSVAAIDDYQHSIGKNLTWAYFANDWLDGEVAFPHQNVQACREAGVIPYIRMMPWSRMEGGSEPDPVFTMSRFLRGDFDDALYEWSKAAKNSGGPLMVEFGPEVNGKWFPWNGKWNGGATTTGYGDPHWPDGPERFRDVFRRIVTQFRSWGVDNVTWVFHIDSSPEPESNWNDMRYYYPGDNFVDWIGVSVFGAQLPSHEWSWFSDRLSERYDEITALSPSLPLLIAEFGVIEGQPYGKRKAQWIEDAMSSLINGFFPRVRGAAYWHSKGWLETEQGWFRLDSSPQSLETFRTSIADSRWVVSPLFR